ncbi:MAG: thioesterase family protein [Nocardioidaceae bacterium]
MTANRIVTPYEGTGERDWDPQAPIPAPLELHRTPVRTEWVDYNGHMSESCYLQVFGDNSDAFFRYLGIGERYRAAGHSLFTVETHLHHLREVSADEPLRLLLRLLDHDRKRLHVFHEMRHGGTDLLLATAEQLLVHVDTAAGRSAPLPDELLQRVDAVARSHAALVAPDAVGRPIGIRRGGGADGVRADR